MANERKTEPLIMLHGENGCLVNDFPADKFEELKSFAETLTQPANVPNMSPQPASSSSSQITLGPTIIDYYKEQKPIDTFTSNRRGSLLEFVRRRKDRVTPKSPEPKTSNPFC